MQTTRDRQLRLIEEIPSLLEGIARLWLIGGWAIDFFAGTVRREHDDIDWITMRDRKGVVLQVLHDHGFRVTHDLGWHTRLTRDPAREHGGVEVDFLDENDRGIHYPEFRVCPDVDPKYFQETEILRGYLTAEEKEEAEKYFIRESLEGSEQGVAQPCGKPYT